MTPEQVYNHWRSTLKEPETPLFVCRRTQKPAARRQQCARYASGTAGAEPDIFLKSNIHEH